jgi:hypothetical protein
VEDNTSTILAQRSVLNPSVRYCLGCEDDISSYKKRGDNRENDAIHRYYCGIYSTHGSSSLDCVEMRKFGLPQAGGGLVNLKVGEFTDWQLGARPARPPLTTAA